MAPPSSSRPMLHRDKTAVPSQIVLERLGDRRSLLQPPCPESVDEAGDREEAAVTIFQIRQRAGGAILWTGAAQDERTALDAMAREAGYRDFAALPEAIRGRGIEANDLGRIG